MSQIIDENVLWKAAEKLRDKCDPADYKNVVLGLVFLKYVSDKYVAEYNKLKADPTADENDNDYYIADHVFIVPKDALWSEVSKHSKQEDLGQIIDNAFVSLEKSNNQLKGILPKTYSKSDLDKTALGELIDFFTNNLNMEDADGTIRLLVPCRYEDVIEICDGVTIGAGTCVAKSIALSGLYVGGAIRHIEGFNADEVINRLGEEQYRTDYAIFHS